MDRSNSLEPHTADGRFGRWLRGTLQAVGIEGENTSFTSELTPSTTQALTLLRLLVGLVMLYDAWGSLSWSHKTEMASFLGVGMESAWVALVVAGVSFLKIAIAASMLSGRGVTKLGWAGFFYGLFVWIAIEHGGDFGQDATDPGVGLAYIILFLFVIGAERLRSDPDLSHNEILAFARVLFGLLWAYDATLKLQPYFLDHYLDYLTAAQKDVAGTWQASYDQIWIVLSQAVGPQLVAWLVALTEAAIAISLFSGRWLRVFGPVGLGLSFVIWSTAEEWGGPYSMGIASMMPMRLFGMAVIYLLTFFYVWAFYNPLDLLNRSRAAVLSEAK
ncbi:MAG: hypothetical protein GC186_20110 [Rhodobacteraceae bacterium]|nr:hypothetical protein [Paracoccaceae bacterium]